MTSLYSQFNRLGNARKSLIQKALDSSAGRGEALIPEKLEQIITNTVVRLSPELAMIEPEFDNQKFHEFNRLTKLPEAGGAIGESAITPTRNATYARDTVEMKVIRRKGSVTNFLQDTSEKYIDAAAAEMENHLVSHIYDLNTYNLWGNAGADNYAYSGLDAFIETNRENLSAASAVPTDLSFLDDMIDANLERQGAQHKLAFLMSPGMQSKVSQLLTNVRLNQGLNGGLNQIEINGGWRLSGYRDIPIIPTSAMKPKTKMGVVAAAGTGAGSGIPAGDYWFRVAPVTYNGEEEASDEVTITIATEDTVDLTWAAVPGALFYKIYSGTTDGDAANLLLVREISGWEYDGTGAPTAQVTGYSFTSDPAAPDVSVPVAMQSDHPYVAVAGVVPETIVLWDMDKYQGLGKLPYTNRGGSRFQGLVTMEPLAITDDFVPFMIKTYAALCPSFEATSVMKRGIRTA